MHTVGTALIYAAVTIRALVWYATGSYWGAVIILLALFGCLLFSEPVLERRLSKGESRLQRWFQVAYLLVQTSLVIALLLIPPLNDFPALLFTSLSLQAVMFYRQRMGFLWIVAFTLIMAAILVRGGQMVAQGLVMALLFGGCCYLVGSYAHLIRTAESIRQSNQRTHDELQTAYRRLQGSARQRQRLAAEQERGRLARELHDSVTQTVFSMNLAAQTASFLWPKDSVRVNAQLDRFLELAGNAMHEIGALVTHLGSKAIAQKGLAVAIKQLVAERQARDGLQIRLEIRGEQDLPEPVNMGLYNIVQEALTNVAKHAGTPQASIQLDLTGNPFFLEIQDWGTGFDVASSQARPGHIGLAEMADQANDIGCKLTIDSQPGRGTRIRLEQRTDSEQI
jgi:signal transduction histidine kinase